MVGPTLVLVVLLVLMSGVLDSVAQALGLPLLPVVQVARKQVGVPLQWVHLLLLLLDAKHREGWRHCASSLQPSQCGHVHLPSRLPTGAYGLDMPWCALLCHSCPSPQVCNLDILALHRDQVRPA